MNCRLVWGVLTLGITAVGGAFAQAQDVGIQGCRAFAALSTSAYYDDIFVNVGRQNGRSGNFGLTWEAWISDVRAITGTCESDVRGTIVRFDRLAEKDGRKPGYNSQGGFSQNGGFNQTGGQNGGFGQPGRPNQGGGFGGASNNGAGAATLDNAGRGTFNGLGFNNTQLDHTHLVMQNGRAIVTLAAGFSRVTLQGQVTRQISDREFEITIDGSDRGRATGQVLLRMSPGHNEAEEIVVTGTSGRQQFSGRFNQ